MIEFRFLFREVLVRLWCIIPFTVAYYRRGKIKKGSFLWGFLHDNNLYGDSNYKSDKKNNFWKAFSWNVWRNPRHNKYHKGVHEVVEYDFKGHSTCKYNLSGKLWRTYKTETGNRNGELIIWSTSPIGKQFVTFMMDFYDNKGKIIKTKKGFRKSKCLPFIKGDKLIIKSKRSGFEDGRPQYSNNKRKLRKSDNLKGYNRWLKRDWITTEY